MRIHTHRADRHSISLEILNTLPGDTRESHVNVTASARFGAHQMEEVLINWSSMGSRPIADAIAYTEMLTLASKLGARLTINLQSLYAGMKDGVTDDIMLVMVSKTVSGILDEVAQ